MVKRRILTILQVIPKLQTGGVERGAVDVACFLKQQGHIPLVVSAGGKLLAVLRRHKIPHVTLPVDSKNPFVVAFNAFRIARLIRKHHVNIVHARSRAPAWSAYWACQRTKCAFLTTFHGTYNFKGRLKQKYNAVMTYGKKVIAPSQFIKDHILNHYPFRDPRRILVVPRGVDAAVFNAFPLEVGRLKELFDHYRLPFDKKMILMPGRITRWKGHQVLLEAVTRLKRDDFAVVFLGATHKKNKGYYQELQTSIVDRNLGSRVFLIDETDDIAAFYKMAYGVVSASTDPEAFGRVMAEAGAVGRPIIASDHGGAREIVVPGKTGWLFPSGNSDKLAECLDKLLSLSFAAYKTMSKTATDHIQKNFSNEQMLAKTLTVYESLV